MDIVTRVDEYFLRAKVPIPYPSILINSRNVEALPVLMGALEDGDVSIIFEYDGKYNVAKKKISRSALVLKKVLEVYKFTLLLSPTEKFTITKPTDLLEVGEWKP